MDNRKATDYNKKYQNKTRQLEENQLEDHEKPIFATEAVVSQEEIHEPKVEEKADASFLVKVDIDCLNIRKGPGMDCERTGDFTGKGTFVITDVKDGNGSNAGWGRLESGEGWISLDYATRV